MAVNGIGSIETVLERLSAEKGDYFVEQTRRLFRDASVGAEDDSLVSLKKTAELLGGEQVLEEVLSKTDVQDLDAIVDEKEQLARGIVAEMSTYGLGAFLFRVLNPYVPLPAKTLKGGTVVKDRSDVVIKLGIDPTYSDLHVGHIVPLRKAAQFAELGYTVELILGTRTAEIGDPTERDDSRGKADPEEIKANAAALERSIKKRYGKNTFKIRRNHEWFDRMSEHDFQRIANIIPFQVLLSRKEIRTRMQKGHTPTIEEILYPIYQAADSVELGAHIELGGNDQTFNISIAREVQKASGIEEELGLMMPILLATRGLEKMSKSAHGTCVLLSDTPFDMFSKVMEIEDWKIVQYFQLLTDVNQEQIELYARDLGVLTQIQAKAKKYLARFTACSEEGLQLKHDFITSFMRGEANGRYSATLKDCAAQIKDVLLDIHNSLRKRTYSPQYTVIVNKGGNIGVEGLDEVTRQAIEDMNISPDVKDLSDPKHPINIKKVLAKEVVAIYHNSTAKARLAERQFNSEKMGRYVEQEAVFRELPTVTYTVSNEGKVDVSRFLVDIGVTTSRSAAMNLITSGSVYFHSSDNLAPEWGEARYSWNRSKKSKLPMISPRELHNMVVSVGKKPHAKVLVQYQPAESPV